MNTDKIISYGIGRRKQAIAQVILKSGTGKLTINEKLGNLYLQDNSQYIQKINNPFLILGIENNYDINIKTRGGGLTGQTDAITLGIARALVKLASDNRGILKKAGLLTRDSRIKERKKYGLKKARKASQFSKR
jgi:small subunit ribosomal protein S9|tara:strand:- start:5883 stop:6284 length:402 start_codon:yes stop_codon:yes gene_type:complete